MHATVSTIDFDHHSKDFAENRDRILSDIRARSPIAYTESHGGYWVITSYPLATYVLEHPEIFSSEKLPDGSRGVTIPSVGPRLLPAEVDAPFHTQLRGVVMSAFSPASLRTLDGVVDNVVRTAVDRLIENGCFDIVEDVAEVVPALVCLRQLGFPEQGRAAMVEAVKIALKTGTPNAEAAHAFQEACAQMMAFVQQRRGEPADDLMSTLVRCTAPTLSDEELMWLGMTLLVGGFKNPGALISNMLLHLGIDTALRQRLIADRTKIPAAVQEFLRFYSPGVSVARTVVQPVEIGGVSLGNGDRVLVLLPSANRDESVFEDADRFDIDRPSRPRHLAFGAGPHFCAGFKLAAMMFERLLTEIFDRMPNYTVDATKAVRVDDAGIQAGYVSIPATSAECTALH